MRAREETILNLIGGLDKCFIIPPFQRNYEWSHEQCDELFDDIITAYKTKKTHYLGNVIYYSGENGGAAYSEFILVDGQQRVTTILLLLCAIRDVAEDEAIKQSINIRYLKNDTNMENYRIRLKQTSYDSDDFISVIDGKVNEAHQDSNIVKNYKRFVELLNKCDIEPKIIYDTITKLEVVDVNLQISNDLNAVQTIFEKINSTGKKLTSADLIRNYLLLANSSKEQEDLYKNYWIPIETNVKNENISRFARDYLIMNVFDDVPDDAIYKMFKEHFNETSATHTEILDSLRHFSTFFQWIKFECSPSEKVNKELSYLNLLRTDDLYSLYMYLFDRLFNTNTPELLKILRLLVDFMIRYRIVAPSGGGGALRSVVNQLLEKLNSEEITLSYETILFELSNSSAVSGRFPDDMEFKEALMKSVNTNYARALLLRIEDYETKNISVPLKEVTVEHLMPQKLSSWWIDNLGGKEQADRIYDTYLNCIGNLTPMSLGYNSVNSNKPWNLKLNQIKDVQFNITSQISRYEKWTENEIKQRNQDISDRACSAITSPLKRTRPYQTKTVSEEFSAGLYSLSDISTPMSGTNVRQILFESKVISVASWKNFFTTICELAFDYDNNLMSEIAKNNSIHKSTSKKNYPEKDPIISVSKDKLVDPIEIKNSGVFVESCLSSDRARVYAKELLDIYGITDAFQIEVE